MPAHKWGSLSRLIHGVGEVIIKAEEFGREEDNPRRRAALELARCRALHNLGINVRKENYLPDDAPIISESHSYTFLPVNIGGRIEVLVSYSFTATVEVEAEEDSDPPE